MKIPAHGPVNAYRSSKCATKASCPSQYCRARWSVTIPVDPLRLRVRFLGVLQSSRRTEFLALAEHQLLVQIKEAEKECRSLDAKKDPFSYLLARGVAKIARARLAWIREATELLVKRRP